jgi:CRISPR-associated endonuclease/helicase Cas3
MNFDIAFAQLTGNHPFPWQQDLYENWFSKGKFPDACTLPTGLGKTSVVAIWLIALANAPDRVPRRLVYVVNRRTVVDQTTTEAEKMRRNAVAAAVPIPAISTLRGQFADNREWSADPSKPAIIVGTVDMIGSRLLFSGYGIGFKLKPLHAGFLGQDVLLIHDEAHLEKPFQDLLEAIECEQRGDRGDTGSLRSDFRPLRVMALTATPRGGELPFELTEEERNPPEVIPDGPEPLHVAWRRLRAKKALTLVSVADESDIVQKIVEMAWKRGQEHPDSRVIVFVREVKAVAEVEKGLRAKKVPEANISTLTGTMRGLERNRQSNPRHEKGDRVFARFLNPPKPGEEPWKVTPQPGTVYLICTAAGEVGVDISADHLVCDLTPFDSLAQRFGRVNRYGSGDARIDVIYEEKPNEKKKDLPFEQRRWLALQRLIDLGGDASPHAIARLPLAERIAAATPTPIVLPVSDILFDAWALTSIRGRLPGRPMVEPYLHGISGWEPPETHVGWREEVGVVTERLLDDHKPQELLEDYPLKPHELLRDNSDRVLSALKKLKAGGDTPVWIVSEDDSVRVTALADIRNAGQEAIEGKTVLLPPRAGGLSKAGMLTDSVEPVEDVAAAWFEDAEEKVPRRVRRWSDEPKPEAVPEMRLVREIDTTPDAEEEVTADEEDQVEEVDRETRKGRYWRWYVRPRSADDDGSKTFTAPIPWDDHTIQVTRNVEQIVDVLLRDRPELAAALVLAAKCHDLGKRREVWQRSIGNPKPKEWYAKSGRDPITGNLWRPLELTKYRHEFGSLVDLLDENQEYRPELRKLPPDMQDLVLHLIAVHHGNGRPHFLEDQAFDPEPKGQKADEIAASVVQRFARLQQQYGRWGLAYLESLLRAADYAASARPCRVEEVRPARQHWKSVPNEGETGSSQEVEGTGIRVAVDPTNPGQFFACCGLLELADQLWPGAEGWYEGGEFCIACGGSLQTLLAALVGAVPEEITRLENGLEVKRLLAPLRLTFEADNPLTFTLDAWMTVRADKGDVVVAANPPWNFWSGQQTPLRIWSPVRAALARMLPGLDSVKARELFTQREFLTGRFGFDPGPAWNALDVGFSPNEQGISVESSPAVELLAAVGIQRFRPRMGDSRDCFDYFTWGIPLPPAVAAAAADGAIPCGPGNRYRARVISRGQYAALGYSKMLFGGPNE